MPKPTNREEFKDYIFRRLGYPIQPIPVDDEQAFDRIDDALDFFRDYHYDGTKDLFFTYQLTQEDINNQCIPVPEYIYGLTHVLDTGFGASNRNLLSPQRTTINELLVLGRTTSTVDYHLAMTNIAELNFLLNQTPGIRFNRHTDKLYLNWDWGQRNVGEYVVVVGHGYLKEEEYMDIFADRWLKEYATQLVKRQMGENMKLTGGVQLLGGNTLNGTEIWQEANERIVFLEDQMIKNLAHPALDVIG